MNAEILRSFFRDGLWGELLRQIMRESESDNICEAGRWSWERNRSGREKSFEEFLCCGFVKAVCHFICEICMQRLHIKSDDLYFDIYNISERLKSIPRSLWRSNTVPTQAVYVWWTKSTISNTFGFKQIGSLPWLSVNLEQFLKVEHQRGTFKNWNHVDHPNYPFIATKLYRSSESIATTNQRLFQWQEIPGKFHSAPITSCKFHAMKISRRRGV